MYGPDEHRYYMSRLQDTNQKLGESLDGLKLYVQELLSDADGVTPLADVRLYLRSALASTDDAMRAIDQAVALLPTPLAPPVKR